MESLGDFLSRLALALLLIVPLAVLALAKPMHFQISITSVGAIAIATMLLSGASLQSSILLMGHSEKLRRRALEEAR